MIKKILLVLAATLGLAFSYGCKKEPEQSYRPPRPMVSSSSPRSPHPDEEEKAKEQLERLEAIVQDEIVEKTTSIQSRVDLLTYLVSSQIVEDVFAQIPYDKLNPQIVPIVQQGFYYRETNDGVRKQLYKIAYLARADIIKRMLKEHNLTPGFWFVEEDTDGYSRSRFCHTENNEGTKACQDLREKYWGVFKYLCERPDFGNRLVNSDPNIGEIHEWLVARDTIAHGLGEERARPWYCTVDQLSGSTKYIYTAHRFSRTESGQRVHDAALIRFQSWTWYGNSNLLYTKTGSDFPGSFIR